MLYPPSPLPLPTINLLHLSKFKLGLQNFVQFIKNLILNLIWETLVLMIAGTRYIILGKKFV